MQIFLRTNQEGKVSTAKMLTGYSTLPTSVFPVRLAEYTKQPSDTSKNILYLMK